MDVLVNNAGVLPEATSTRAASPVDAALFRRTFETNVFACANNPVPLVLPCHRVVRADGSVGQYLGGTDAKVYLLELERAGNTGPVR